MKKDSKRIIGLFIIIVGFATSITLSSCTLLADLMPTKEKIVNVNDWLVVPIFFATNRKRTDSGQLDFLEEKNNNVLLFGVKNVIVPCPASLLTQPKVVKRMGWSFIHLDKPIPSNDKPDLSKEKSSGLSDSEYNRNAVVNAFNNYRGITGSEDAVLFIHGCCATFKTTIERAAKLAVQMQVPVVVYDWVSPIGFTHYLENETLAQQTYDGFCTFLDTIATYIPTENTVLVGHSMGAGFIDEAFTRRYQRTRDNESLPKYKEIILSQPDIDARSYINHQNSVVSQTDKTQIFMVLDDPRLSASALAHGGYERLGRPGILLTKLYKNKEQDVIDMTVSGIGHNLPVEFIGDMYRTDTIKNKEFKLTERTSHLFVLERNGVLPTTSTP